MLDSIKTVIFYVKDIEKSKDFYLSVLGFIIEEDQGDFISFKINKSDNVSLAINLASTPEKMPGKQTVLLKAINIEDLYESIRDKVNIIDSLTQQEWGKTFAFIDIDGNKIEVVE